MVHAQIGARRDDREDVSHALLDGREGFPRDRREAVVAIAGVHRLARIVLSADLELGLGQERGNQHKAPGLETFDVAAEHEISLDPARSRGGEGMMWTASRLNGVTDCSAGTRIRQWSGRSRRRSADRDRQAAQEQGGPERRTRVREGAHGVVHERRREEGQGIQGGVDEHAREQGGGAQADEAEGEAQREREHEPVEVEVHRREEQRRGDDGRGGSERGAQRRQHDAAHQRLLEDRGGGGDGEDRDHRVERVCRPEGFVDLAKALEVARLRRPHGVLQLQQPQAGHPEGQAERGRHQRRGPVEGPQGQRLSHRPAREEEGRDRRDGEERRGDHDQGAHGEMAGEQHAASHHRADAEKGDEQPEGGVERDDRAWIRTRYGSFGCHYDGNGRRGRVERRGRRAYHRSFRGSAG